MTKKQFTISSLTAVILVGFIALGYIGLQWVHPLFSSNHHDNNSLEAQAEMAKTACEWGRLANLPPTKKEFHIKTEGSAFARSFRGSFRDTPKAIQQWATDSSGIQESQNEILPNKSIKYHLKVKNDILFGEVSISEDMEHVSFYIVSS